MNRFRRGLSEHGYFLGRNLIIDARYAAGESERVAALAHELAALKPDLFVVLGPQAALAAKKAAPNLPIVFANVQDPLASGLVTSLARPGGNMTGMSDFHAASVTKRLELIKEAIPTATRIAVMWNPTSASNVEQVRDLEAVAPRLGVSLISVPIQGREDLEPALHKIKGERAAALLLLGDIVLTTNMRLIADRAIELRLPAVYTARSWTDVGGFMAYGANFPELYRRSAVFVDKIVKGAKPGELPIEQATKFDLVINLKTARALGLTVPRSLLLRADHVIE
jgi:putative ABC transport system substrate-binding protein